MTMTSPDLAAVRDAFLAELTDVLAATGWIRTDRDHFGIVTPEFTHPSSAAALTVTGAVWNRPGACLWRDDSGVVWNVASDNPAAVTMAAAANATLPDARAIRPLAELLEEAGWSVRHEHEAGRLLESLWASAEGVEVSLFPGDRHETPGWLIVCPGTPREAWARAQYASIGDVPDAVLSALVFDH